MGRKERSEKEEKKLESDGERMNKFVGRNTAKRRKTTANESKFNEYIHCK